MMAKKPVREDYQAWQNRQFVLDSIAWEQDPLYGWCNKNFKRDGKPYNIYTDGLKIMTTIDSRMQKYAEEAVFAQVAKNLQPAFNRANKSKRNAPSLIILHLNRYERLCIELWFRVKDIEC